MNTYSFNVFGTLTLLSSISVMPADFKGAAPAAADLHVTPDGRFLFASERTSNTIAAFGVDSGSGKLTLMGNYPTETQPRGFAIDPQGKYLLAVGQKSNRLSTYEIDQKSGALRKLSHLGVGRIPTGLKSLNYCLGEPATPELHRGCRSELQMTNRSWRVDKIYLTRPEW